MPTGSWLCFLPQRLVEAGSICKDPKNLVEKNRICKESWGNLDWPWWFKKNGGLMRPWGFFFRVFWLLSAMDSPWGQWYRKDWGPPMSPEVPGKVAKTGNCWWNEHPATMSCIPLMSILTTSTKQIMEESITWFSIPQGCLPCNQCLWIASIGTGGFPKCSSIDDDKWRNKPDFGAAFSEACADHGWPLWGLGSYLYESLLSITHHGWWYMITTHEKYFESNRLYYISNIEISRYYKLPNLVILFANLKIIPRCVFQVHQPKEKLAFLEAARAQAMSSFPENDRNPQWSMWICNDDVNLTSISQINRNFMGIHPYFMGIYQNSSISGGNQGS